MAVDIEWEKFLGGPTLPPEKRWHATLSRHLRIHLNTNLFNRLGKPEAVCLFFNRNQQKIAIQASSSRLNESFPVKRFGNGTYFISAAPFCTHYGIKISATHRFIHPDFSPDGKLVLNLNETVIVSRVRRRQKHDR